MTIKTALKKILPRPARHKIKDNIKVINIKIKGGRWKIY